MKTFHMEKPPKSTSELEVNMKCEMKDELEEMREALRCLYLDAPQSVCDEIIDKFNAYKRKMEEQLKDARIDELQSIITSINLSAINYRIHDYVVMLEAKLKERRIK